MPDTISMNVDNVTSHNTDPSTTPIASTNYLCNSCQINFLNGQEQRQHMRKPWQYVNLMTLAHSELTKISIHNLQRRIASLPPVSLDEFNRHNEKEAILRDVSANDENNRSARGRKSRRNSDIESELNDESDKDNHETTSAFQCLFCNYSFAPDDTGFALNLEHMYTAHGMTIPHSEQVTDLQRLISYLSLEIRTWHECLYCGATKPSTRSVQSHMRDKGHCLLNLEREPELLDFWEPPMKIDDGDDNDREEDAEDVPTRVSETELRFSSGKVISSRHARPQRPRKPESSDQRMELFAPLSDSEERPPPFEDHQPNSNRQLTRREEMSIIGISTQQRRALVLAEKKAQRSEAIARRARDWVYAKAANSQEFDQIDSGKGIWGKQQHKLLPR